MAASPRFKIFTADNEYIGSTKYVEDAAALVAFQGDAATIRDGHVRIVWREGEGFDGRAAESYDHVVEVVAGRVHPKSPLPLRG